MQNYTEFSRSTLPFLALCFCEKDLLSTPRLLRVWPILPPLGHILSGGHIKGTNTIFFIRKGQIPVERRKDTIYGSYNCDDKPNKEEKWRNRLTAGGDRMNYPDDCGTPTAEKLLFKILLKSIVLAKGAKCFMINIKDFYLNTPMKQYK
jgi:hypothetical protein